MVQAIISLLQYILIFIKARIITKTFIITIMLLLQFFKIKERKLSDKSLRFIPGGVAGIHVNIYL